MKAHGPLARVSRKGMEREDGYRRRKARAKPVSLSIKVTLAAIKVL